MRGAWILAMLMISGTAHAAPPAQIAQSFEDAVLPANNVYGSPSSIRKDSGVLYATTKCGGYVAILLRTAYAQVTTDVLRGLTGSASPTSKQWNDAIENGATFTERGGTFRFHERATIDEVASGDVFASEYELPDATGHTMLIDTKRLDATGVPTTIPGLPTADRWLVRVHDSTTAPHGPGDSRASTGYDGIGNGWIYIFADPMSGVIVGWTWSTVSPTPFQTTEPAAPNYRPVAVGYLTGPST